MNNAIKVICMLTEKMKGNLKTFVCPMHVAHTCDACFLNRGASHAVKNVAGYTPLMTAIIAGNVEVLLHMLRAISNTEDVPIRDILRLPAKNNKNIFTWAIQSNHIVLINVSID